jgi:hypothetical protein
MELETRQRLTASLDKVIHYFCRLSGTQSYEEAFAALRVQFADKGTSPAPWIHKVAQKAFPTNELDTIDPTQFHEILGVIDTREKMNFVLATLPDEAAPKIEEFLGFLLNEFFPNQKAVAQQIATTLPQRHTGGRKSRMPSTEVCRQICGYISALHHDGALMIGAQNRAASKFDLSLRMIQRIWSARAAKSPSN